MHSKKCSKCNKTKCINEFSKHRITSDGYQAHCKKCCSEYREEYMKTKDGLVSRIYGNQNASSRKRGHNSVSYSKEELKEWLYSQEKFHLLYDNWKRLDFQKEYVPSVDRKDDYIGYTISNIQLMTWSENREKGHKDRKCGINNKHSKSIVQYSMEGKKLSVFHSIMEAERKTGIDNGNISKCCLGKSKSAGGYIWKHE